MTLDPLLRKHLPPGLLAIYDVWQVARENNLEAEKTALLALSIEMADWLLHDPDAREAQKVVFMEIYDATHQVKT